MVNVPKARCQGGGEGGGERKEKEQAGQGRAGAASGFPGCIPPLCSRAWRAWSWRSRSTPALFWASHQTGNSRVASQRHHVQAASGPGRASGQGVTSSPECGLGQEPGREPPPGAPRPQPRRSADGFPLSAFPDGPRNPGNPGQRPSGVQGPAWHPRAGQPLGCGNAL